MMNRKNVAIMLCMLLLMQVLWLAGCAAPVDTDVSGGVGDASVPGEMVAHDVSAEPDLVSPAGDDEKPGESPVPNKQSTAVWKEKTIVELPDELGEGGVINDGPVFQGMNAYVFSGTIISRKAYEVTRTDSEGKVWGPYPQVIIEVKVNKEYKGKSPTEGDIIKICTQGLAVGSQYLVRLKDGNEYVFKTVLYDEKYLDILEKEYPEGRFGEEKYADAFFTHTLDNAFPIKNGNVFVQKNFFFGDGVEAKALSYDTVEADNLVDRKPLEEGNILALRREDFDEAFARRFKG